MLRDFCELVVVKHTVFSASFALIAFVVDFYHLELDLSFGIYILAMCSLSVLFARNFAMCFNRILDRDVDSSNPRTRSRPSVDGRLGLFSMVVFCFANATAFVLTSYFINSMAFILSIPFLFILAFYSFVKRFSYLSHMFLGLALGLAPVSVTIALGGHTPLWVFFLSLGVVFWVAGFDVLYSIQDVDYDLNEGLFSIPARFGVLTSIGISRFFHVLAAFFWLCFLCISGCGLYSAFGLFVSICFLFYEHYLVKIDLGNINRAFFTANGLLGLVFLVFVFLDFSSRALHGV